MNADFFSRCMSLPTKCKSYLLACELAIPLCRSLPHTYIPSIFGGALNKPFPRLGRLSSVSHLEKTFIDVGKYLGTFLLAHFVTYSKMHAVGRHLKLGKSNSVWPHGPENVRDRSCLLGIMVVPFTLGAPQPQDSGLGTPWLILSCNFAFSLN